MKTFLLLSYYFNSVSIYLSKISFAVILTLILVLGSNTGVCLRSLDLLNLSRNKCISSGDTSQPTIFCPPDITIRCEASTSPANTDIPSTIDHCANGITNISFLDSKINGSCRSNFNLYRNWTAVDSCGNSVSCKQEITIIDTTRPRVFCPEDLTLDCHESILPSRTGISTSIDNCTIRTTHRIYSDDIIYGTTCSDVYIIIRTWSDWDSCGNSNTCNQVITIQDTIAPSIHCPIDLTISCDQSTAPVNTGIAAAMDNCTDHVSNIKYLDQFSHTSNSGNYTIERNWVAVDSCLNQRNCQQLIVIPDSLKLDLIKITNSTNGTGGKIEISVPNADSLYFIDANSNALINKTGLDLAAGTYFVRAFIGNCNYIYGPYIIELLNSSKNSTPLQFAVYPSPFKDKITIESALNSKLQYELINGQGQTIKRGNFLKKESIETTQLISGLYFLRCYGLNNSGTIKIYKI